MITVAKIKPNLFSFDGVDVETILSATFKDILKNYIDMITINYTSDTDLLFHFLQYIDKDMISQSCGTHMCYETQTQLIYQLYKTVGDSTEKNTLARFLSENHEDVFGNTIILGTQLIDGKQTNVDMSYDMVVDIIRNKIVHKAILLKPDNSHKEIFFTKLPIENSPLIENNCRCIHIEFWGRVIALFMEMSPKKDIINTYATIIGKKLKIYGDVVITMLTTSPHVEVCNLTDELFDKLLVILSDHSISRTNCNETTPSFLMNIQKTYDKTSKTINISIPDDVFIGPTYNSTLN